MTLLARLGAMALALVPAAVLAQTSPNIGKEARLPADFAPGTVIYCDDGTGHVALCSFASGGGGGGSGDASAANQTTQITRATEIRDRIGALTSPAAGSTNAYLATIASTLAGPLTVGTHGVTQSGSWTVQLGASGLGGSSGNPLYVATPSSGTTGAPGTTAPTNAQQVAGVGPSGNLRAIATDTRGALQSQQVQYLDSNTVSLVANATAVQIDADVGGTAMTAPQRAARIYFTVQLVTATTAPVYLCFGGQGTSCSATSYSYLLPAGATIGTLFTPPAGASGAIYAWSTAAVTLKVSSQVAQ